MLPKHNMAGTVMRGANSHARVGGPPSARKDRVGNWEIPRLAVRLVCGPHREGEEPKPMMHGGGKSDEAIVAVKPVNQAAQAGREPVERRAEAKGNAGQTSTRQTQSRESVTQGLERIREVAKVKEKERFTALFHHLSHEHLETAFFELEEKAAAGVDGLTWHSYAADLEGNLVKCTAGCIEEL